MTATWIFVVTFLCLLMHDCERRDGIGAENRPTYSLPGAFLVVLVCEGE